MSTEHYMVCHKCKAGLWIAQEGFRGFTFYSGEPDCMRVFRVFLLDHQQHPLELVPDHKFEDLLEQQGYVEIEWKQPRAGVTST